MSDPINPDHYKGDGAEAIEVIEQFGLCYHLGNSVKYILRCRHKGAPATDLRKAIWYLQREIALIEQGKECSHRRREPSQSRSKAAGRARKQRARADIPSRHR